MAVVVVAPGAQHHPHHSAAAVAVAAVGGELLSVPGWSAGTRAATWSWQQTELLIIDGNLIQLKKVHASAFSLIQIGIPFILDFRWKDCT